MRQQIFKDVFPQKVCPVNPLFLNFKKNQLMKYLALLFSLLIFFSCSQHSLIKRRYMKGFYVSRSGHPKPVHIARKNPQAEPVALSEIQVPVNSPGLVAEVLKEVVVGKPVSALFSSSCRPMASVPNRNLALCDRRAVAHFIPYKKLDILRNEKRPSSSGVNDIVLIILCFILPPLAVYLFKNAIDTNFWVDVILTLLLWLPGLIFALLVCFGGVSV
jgi:uncharacterized membrane protein YqaE (UPF0057 family)